MISCCTFFNKILHISYYIILQVYTYIRLVRKNKKVASCVKNMTHVTY